MASPRARALLFVSGNPRPYLNHQRAGQSRKVRTWLGDRTRALWAFAAKASVGTTVTAVSGATITSVQVLSTARGNSGRSGGTGKATSTCGAGLAFRSSAGPTSHLAPAWPG